MQYGSNFAKLELAAFHLLRNVKSESDDCLDPFQITNALNDLDQVENLTPVQFRIGEKLFHYPKIQNRSISMLMSWAGSQNRIYIFDESPSKTVPWH